MKGMNQKAKMDVVKEETTTPVNNADTEEVVENALEPINKFEEAFIYLMQELGLDIRNVILDSPMFAPKQEDRIDLLLEIEQIVDLFNERSNKSKITISDVEEILLRQGVKGQIHELGYVYGIKLTGGYASYSAVKQFITPLRAITSEKQDDSEAKELAKKILSTASESLEKFWETAFESLEKQNKFYETMTKWFDKQNKAKA